VLIDEAQMLQTRELMEEFRGLLNLETPEHYFFRSPRSGRLSAPGRASGPAGGG
jgi:hypothetical protein